MHVTVCLAGQKVDVEVGEDCRSLQALREAIVEALPQLWVEGFDVSVGGRALDDDEGIASLEENVCLDVSANTRGLSVLALREAGREVSEDGLLAAVREGDVALSTLFLDAGVPIDCADARGMTPLFVACREGFLEIATFLLDRGSTAIDAKGEQKTYPHLLVVLAGNASWRLAREAFRSSWSRYAWHRSHIQQLLQARTKFQRTATARAGRLGRAKWSGDGPGRRRPQVRVAWDSRSSPFFIPGSSREGVSPSGTPTPSAHTRRPRRPRRVRGYR